ncbi:permease prefix domain 1-containing protein [Amycolatopsis taiwanensis]|uniref:Uncharacterized protein n=1 Tax=Amycolatopsis taiwanensis TaxID=342230 RepID=A0A9W6R985_9PSEU|nr:permease prefix domain 1-containing protein [Amycolatopsis taiwanensis]GLY69867.1 hypothetical protein Atai01_64860 [Amycolatopsis taiwanensis]
MTELIEAGAGPIAEHLARLDARLRGPRAAKADLLNEARDGLMDAAEAYRAAGRPDIEAQRLAVRDFGEVDTVAPAYQGELGLAGGIRALRTILIAIPGMHAIFELTRMIWIGDWSSLGGPPAPYWYHQIATITDQAAPVVAALALVGLVAARPLLRRLGSRTAGRVLTLMATAGIAGTALSQMSIMVSTAVVNVGWVTLSMPTTLVGLSSLALMIRLFVLAHQSLLFCRAPVVPR